MPFGVANAPALFEELMNNILSILRRRPVVQELISCGAQMEAHIDDVCLGTNTQEDHLILLGEFFAVCQENHTRLKVKKCEFIQQTMQYLGFDIGYGWWTPAASKAKPRMDAKVRHEDFKTGLHDARSFIGACNFYRPHIKHFTYTSAILTDLIKKSTTWRWGPQEKQAVDEHKDKVANAKCLGVLRAQGEIILVTDGSNVGGGATLFQWQALEKEEFNSAISQWSTDGLSLHRAPRAMNRHGPEKTASVGRLSALPYPLAWSAPWPGVGLGDVHQASSPLPAGTPPTAATTPPAGRAPIRRTQPNPGSLHVSFRRLPLTDQLPSDRAAKSLW